MAKVTIEGDSVCVRVGLLERVALADRTRTIPLSRIRQVDPRPPLADLMVHWSDHGGVWLCGMSGYDGQLVPSARSPANTLALELADEPSRIYIEVDDESPLATAERIRAALRSRGASEAEAPEATTSSSEQQGAQPELLRDAGGRPGGGGSPEASLATPALLLAEPAREMKLDDDGDLARIGGWLVGLGALGLLTGIIMVVGGALPGVLAVGAGVACAMLGGVALAVVAHHQG